MILNLINSCNLVVDQNSTIVSVWRFTIHILRYNGKFVFAHMVIFKENLVNLNPNCSATSNKITVQILPLSGGHPARKPALEIYEVHIKSIIN
jgi:hypothetical protein